MGEVGTVGTGGSTSKMASTYMTIAWVEMAEGQAQSWCPQVSLPAWLQQGSWTAYLGVPDSRNECSSEQGENCMAFHDPFLEVS